MTKSDPQALGFRSPTLRRIVILLVGIPLVLFGFGVFAGFTKGTLEHGAPTLRELAIMAGLLLATLAVIYGAWRLWPRDPSEIVAPSTRRSMHILFAALVLGLVTGIIFALTEGPDTVDLYSNGPINAATAIAGIVVFGVITPAITWMWWRTIDEHEASAYTLGALISAHVYLIFVPVWWLAARAGWVPHQDPMVVWVVIATLWSVVWLYRRFT